MRRLPAASLLALTLAAAAPAAGLAESGPTPGPQGLDARFGACGVLKPQIATPSRFTMGAQRLARTPDGMIIAAGAGTGTGSASNPFTIMLARFSPDGAPDSSFGTAGGVATAIPRPPKAQDAFVTGLAVQPDRKVVVSGYVQLENPNRSQAYLARYQADGTLDPSFGGDGIVQDALPSVYGAQIDDVAIAPDGGIIAVGTRSDAAADDTDGFEKGHFTVARFRASDGVLDPAFGNGGVREIDPGFGGSHANVVDVLADGRILAGGQAGEQFMLARLLATGTPDPTFGSGGTAVDSPPASAEITALTELPDGRIQVVGTGTNITGSAQAALGRYSADGQPDGTFGSGGFRIDRLGVRPSGIAVAPDGKLVVAGGSFIPNADGGSGVIRYGADGTRDGGFGIGGALAGFESFGIETGDVLLDPDGTALVAEAHNDDFAVARFAVDEPALAATASQARACSVYATTKTIKQLLRPGKKLPHGKLTLGFLRRQPGGLRVTAVVKVGSRTATLGKTTDYDYTYGKGVGVIRVSKKAARLLRNAKSAKLTLTAVGTQGGDTATATKTLKRR